MQQLAEQSVMMMQQLAEQSVMITTGGRAVSDDDGDAAAGRAVSDDDAAAG
jgi:hypothetical protein